MDWRTSTFIVGLSAFAIAWGWSTSDVGLCSEGARAAVEMKPGGWCFEFWLNRYQQLISGVLSLAAAGAAALLLWSQLRKMDEQIASAERAGAVGQFEAAVRRRSELHKIQNLAETAFILSKISHDVAEYKPSPFDSDHILDHDTLSKIQMCNSESYRCCVSASEFMAGVTGGPQLLPSLKCIFDVTSQLKLFITGIIEEGVDQIRNAANERMVFKTAMRMHGQAVQNASVDLAGACEREVNATVNLLIELDQRMRG